MTETAPEPEGTDEPETGAEGEASTEDSVDVNIEGPTATSGAGAVDPEA